jgi:hypothetical protein
LTENRMVERDGCHAFHRDRDHRSVIFHRRQLSSQFRTLCEHAFVVDWTSSRPHSTRLNFARVRVGDDELAVAFTVALELAERASHALDDDARRVAEKIRGAGASRPIVLTGAQLEALARVIDAWEEDAETVRALRFRLPS